ncbi:hypothetical protein BBJ28_00023829 [Nothophytophthora sp. Chile5]|nr:hypothetical protein BBJ28_00023829 [Nothophytophthora sp. Chile5]
MMPAVSKITGKSAIFGIHLVEVGDLLLRIGDRVTRDMDFLEAIDYLKEVPKPCTLVFRRLMADPMAVKTVQPKVKSSIGLKLAQKFEELTALENEKFPPQPAVKLEAKYEIKWVDGPLGISLIASKDVAYPLVTRITGKNRSPQVQDVQPGHYLVQIGSYNTADGNFNTAIKFLQKVTKPVSLFFCPGNKKVSVRPEPAEDEYDHIWEKKQPLCFTVRPDAAGHMVVADLGSAKSIKVKVKSGPNNIAAFVSSGDQIQWINDDSTAGLTFHESLLKLRTAKRPLVIRFKKGSPEAALATGPALSLSSLNSSFSSTSSVSSASMTSSSTSVSSSTSSSTSSSSSSPPGSGASAASASPPKAVAAPQQPPPAPAQSRSFNPLKKIAALGNHAKENTSNASNAKTHHDHKKHQDRDGAMSSHSQQHTAQEPGQTAKKLSLYGGHTDPEIKRSTQDGRPPTTTSSSPHAPKVSPHGSRGGHHHLPVPVMQTKDPSPRSTSSSSSESSDGGHRVADSQPKIRNLDSAFRKQPLVKSSSDPIGAESPPLKPLARGGTRHSGSSPALPTGEAGRSRDSHDKDSDVYEVVWPEGTALGLTLRVHPTTRYPVVARVTGTSNLKNIEHVSPGDVLFAANNMNIVPQPKFKQTLENLSRLPKPAVLRFRRAHSASFQPARVVDDSDYSLPRGPPLKEREYELIWRENANLGLVFSSDADVPTVTKVDLESGGPMLHRVSVGDTLAWIGPMDIGGSSFHTSMATLRAIKRPVVLRFYKRGT